MTNLAFLLIVVMTAGCVSSSPEARRQRLHAGLNDREIVTLEAVLYWYRECRDPRHEHSFREDEGAFTEIVKKRISTEIPEFRRSNDGAWYYVRIHKIAFPELPFGYVEIVAGDGLYAHSYVNVFQKKSDGWQIIDSLRLAEGNWDVLTTTFNWSEYFQDLKKKTGPEAVAQGK